jgi:hypothetical protein
MKTKFLIISIFILIAGGYGQRTKKGDFGNKHQTKKEQIVNNPVETHKENEVSEKICQDVEMTVFRQFQPDTLTDFDYSPFDAFKSYKINGLKLLFGGYNTGDYVSDEVKDSPPYNTQNDYGLRLLCFNAEGQEMFRTRGMFDSRSFTPSFFISDDKKQVVILCQTGDEGGSWGAVVFLIKEDKVYRLGSVEEPYDTEKYSSRDIAYFVTIKRINNILEFSFPDTLRVHDIYGTAVNLILDNIRYVYKEGKMIKETIE